MSCPERILEISNLSIGFRSGHESVEALTDVNLHIDRGEILGVVGESGSGKSITGLAVIGLLAETGRVLGGSIRFEGRELTMADEETMRGLRGKRMAMIFQDPMNTLNPVLRIDTQMVEAIRAHERVSYRAALARAQDALAKVGITSPKERLQAYPHQFSGGMRQRVAIAIALLHQPSLVIADEPTTALDVTIQAQILAEVQQLARETGTSLMWITHDLSVVAGLVDRIAVIYAGTVVEQGRVDDVLDRPKHHYTAGLLASVPAVNEPGKPLRQIRGMMPPPGRRGPGCRFMERCDAARPDCALHQTLRPDDRDPTHLFRCAHPLDPVASGRAA